MARRLGGGGGDNGAVSVNARPRRLFLLCAACAVVVVAVCVASSFFLDESPGSGDRHERGDQAGLIVLGVVLALGILALSRARVHADERGIRGRNLIGSYDLPWAAVTRVRFDDDSPWAALDLVEDERMAVMAVMAIDREYALRAVTELRRLHAEHGVAAGGAS